MFSYLKFRGDRSVAAPLMLCWVVAQTSKYKKCLTDPLVR